MKRRKRKVRKGPGFIKTLFVILGVVMALLYNTSYDRFFRDVRRIDRLGKRVYSEAKYQYIKHKYSDWLAEFACLFEDRLSD
jgi:hypothetical protein